MRVNVYAEEMTDRIQIISKEIDGHVFTGLRFYLELPTSLPKGVWLSGPTAEVSKAYAEPPSDETRNVKGPFEHRPGDDDSSAVTFWGKRDLRKVLRSALEMLDMYYEHQDQMQKGREASPTKTAVMNRIEPEPDLSLIHTDPEEAVRRGII